MGVAPVIAAIVNKYVVSHDDPLLHRNPQSAKGGAGVKGLAELSAEASAILNAKNPNSASTYAGLTVAQLHKDLSVLQSFEGGNAPGAKQAEAAIRKMLGADLAKQLEDGKKVGKQGGAALGWAIIDALSTVLHNPKAANTAKTEATKLIAAVKKTYGISSPSTVFMAIGADLTLGLHNGLVGGTPAVVVAAQAVVTKMLAQFEADLPRFKAMGLSFDQSLIAGMQAGQPQVNAAVRAITPAALSAAGRSVGSTVNVTVQASPVTLQVPPGASESHFKYLVDSALNESNQNLVNAIKQGVF